MARDITKQNRLMMNVTNLLEWLVMSCGRLWLLPRGHCRTCSLLLERQGDPHVFASTLDAAHNQILYLGQMVNDLSTLSRAQRGLYMNNEQIDIDDFMTSLYNKYNEEAKNRKLRLIGRYKRHRHGWLFRAWWLRRSCKSLITNAIKYTPKG